MLGMYFRLRQRKEGHALRDLLHSQDLGLTEPVSMHPVINGNRCIGCGACVTACPHGNVLGVIGGQAELVNPTNCIGHGACAAACPIDGIRLVIGSERRGVNIPMLGPDFQTNVPGVFVAGELGGMGLIRNAIEQGRLAIESISKLPGIGAEDERLDTVIVGAGPAGFGASLAALQSGLRFVTIDQERLGGSLVHHPRGKIIVTQPVEIPLVGSVDMRETHKEELLDFWERVRAEKGLRIRENEHVDVVERHSDGSFSVRTDKGVYETRSVLLAVGRRGTPRKLEVPGEESSKVVYSLSDPAQYKGKHVLVVGGGDSALEAAASLAQQQDTNVTLSYRGDAFQRACPNSRELTQTAVDQHELLVLLESQVKEIREESVVLQTGSGRREIPNDAVVVCAGGVLPNDFLHKIGVEIETRYGTPVHG
ncbi:MAG: NAD(P)-binding domain-containing protein [bacterium]|nr:NAD(P)-binding domain-containing protein [bacterium]